MKKSIISLLLALIMAVSLPYVAAFAADNDDPHIEDTPGVTLTDPTPLPHNP